MQLGIIQGTYAICRLGPGEPLPSWASGEFFSVTRTSDELSVVCPAEKVPSGVRAETGFKALRVEGTLDFALTGILANLSSALAQAGVSLFAISTFDTDYLLVREEALERAKTALRAGGHVVSAPGNK